jgi:hypothetical protein
MTKSVGALRRPRGRPRLSGQARLVAVHGMFPPEQRDALFRRAEQVDRSVSYLLREAVRRLLESESDPP